MSLATATFVICFVCMLGDVAFAYAIWRIARDFDR